MVKNHGHQYKHKSMNSDFILILGSLNNQEHSVVLVTGSGDVQFMSE